MSIILPDFSTNGNTFQLVPVEFTSIWYEVPTAEPTAKTVEPVVESTVEPTVDAPKVETKLTPDELANAQASVARTCAKMERRSAYGSPARYNTPTITTKSGKTVKVSPHCTTPYGGSPVVSHITNSKMTSAIGEASAVVPTQPIQLNVFQTPEYSIQVINCKDELLNAESFEEVIATTRKYNAVDKNIVLDAKSQMTKRELGYIEGLKKAYTIIKDSETVKAKATPKVTVTTVAPTVTHNQMMTAIRKLNGGRIPNVIALNKLVTAYIARNNAIISSVSKYITPELCDMVDKAYAQLTA